MESQKYSPLNTQDFTRSFIFSYHFSMSLQSFLAYGHSANICEIVSLSLWQKLHMSSCFIFMLTNVILVHVKLCIILYCRLSKYVDCVAVFVASKVYFQFISFTKCFSHFSILLGFQLFLLLIKEVYISFINGDKIEIFWDWNHTGEIFSFGYFQKPLFWNVVFQLFRAKKCPLISYVWVSNS